MPFRITRYEMKSDPRKRKRALLDLQANHRITLVILAVISGIESSPKKVLISRRSGRDLFL